MRLHSAVIIPFALLLSGFISPTRLEQGIALYWSGQYAETIEVLTQVRANELRSDEKIECLKYIGFSYVAVGDDQGARSAFAELLAFDPRHQLDETLVSPKIVRQFDASRAQLIESLFQEGKTSYFEDDYQATRTTMKRVLALDDDHALAREYLQLASEQEELMEKAAALQRVASPPRPKKETSPEPDNRVYRLTGQITPPVLVKQVQPEYPIAARRVGRQGKVVITVVVGVDGSVVEAKTVRSLSPELDEAALEAVRQWRYRPARLNGRPVAVYRVISLEFELER